MKRHYQRALTAILERNNYSVDPVYDGHLLDNAVKYTNENGTISVTLRKKKNRINLSVINTTESISKEQISHLFDRFYRTDASRNSQTGGYGLGLSIAAATVESHRGKISAETKDEKSLKITVVFPT